MKFGEKHDGTGATPEAAMFDSILIRLTRDGGPTSECRMSVSRGNTILELIEQFKQEKGPQVLEPHEFDLPMTWFHGDTLLASNTPLDNYMPDGATYGEDNPFGIVARFV